MKSSFVQSVNLIGFCLALSLTTACSEQRKLTEMHDNTAEMNKTTTDMNQTTKEMSQTTKEMNDRTKQLNQNTEDMKNLTQQMQATTTELKNLTAQMNQTTLDMAHTTAEMNTRTQQLNQNTADMKNITQQMQTTTVEMDQRTANLEKRADSLFALTGEMYDSLRQGDSMTMRRELFNEIVSSQSPGKKISEAGKYMMAWEFQSWSNIGSDDKNRFEDLLSDAVDEFFKEMQELAVSSSQKPDPTAEGNAKVNDIKNKIASLNAISVTLHLSNRKQTELLKNDPSLKAVTMLSTIKAALALEADVDSGKITFNTLPKYQQTVLENRRIAVLLLQSRYNYLMAMMLGKLTDIHDFYSDYDSVLTKGKIGIEAEKMKHASWDLDISQISLAELKEVNLFLSGALITKNYLNQYHIPLEENDDLASMYSHMQVITSSRLMSGDANHTAKNLSESEQAQAEFVQLVNQLK